jgi:2,3-bisphosphoglycerate-independent phosphoglycerate mutase
MKYIVILGDGMADYDIAELGGTPLDVADKPNIDSLARDAEIGLVQTIPKGFKPGSDTATLSVLGYDPAKYYTGRSPLEAYSLGIKMSDTDLAMRCNLVTLSDDRKFENKTMVDYSSGEISTAEAAELISYIESNLGTSDFHYYAGVSYRHCLIINNGKEGTSLTPPHDITGKKITEHLPNGYYGKHFLGLYKKAYELLSKHPINLARVQKGLLPANCIWLWGEGRRPSLDSFKKKFGLSGSIISAVDLLKGIGKAAGMDTPTVEGATGSIETNFRGKADSALEELTENSFVYIHIESPDECGHQGLTSKKVWAIEQIDKHIVGVIKNEMLKRGEPFALLIMPDHPTPISCRTHVSTPVPYLMWQSNKKLGSFSKYCEKTAEASGIFEPVGHYLMKRFLSLK